MQTLYIVIGSNLFSVILGFSLPYLGRLFGQLLVVHRTRAADKLARSRQGITGQTGKTPALKPGTP